VKGLGNFFVFVFKTHLKLHTLNLINSLFQCNRFCNFLAVKFFTCKIQRAFLNSINPNASSQSTKSLMGLVFLISALDEISKTPLAYLIATACLQTAYLNPKTASFPP
jgi:hypothetical protein